MSVITQRRFTEGDETRFQPNRQRRDFRDLVDDERKLAVLTDAFNAKVTPVIVAEIIGQPETAGIRYPREAAELRNLQFRQRQIDAQYRWYWVAYFPLGSPVEMAPPNNYTFRPASFLENFIGLFNSQKSADSEETIRQQIAQYESSLEEMIRTLGNQNQVAREIDSSEVTAWPAKYRAWLARRQTEVKIQEIQYNLARLKSKLRETIIRGHDEVSNIIQDSHIQYRNLAYTASDVEPFQTSAAINSRRPFTSQLD